VGVAEGDRVRVGVAVATVGHGFVASARADGVGVALMRRQSQYPPPPTAATRTTANTMIPAISATFLCLMIVPFLPCCRYPPPTTRPLRRITPSPISTSVTSTARSM
jgi:hypothetical protein